MSNVISNATINTILNLPDVEIKGSFQHIHAAIGSSAFNRASKQARDRFGQVQFNELTKAFGEAHVQTLLGRAIAIRGGGALEDLSPYQKAKGAIAEIIKVAELHGVEISNYETFGSQEVFQRIYAQIQQAKDPILVKFIKHVCNEPQTNNWAPHLAAIVNNGALGQAEKAEAIRAWLDDPNNLWAIDGIRKINARESRALPPEIGKFRSLRCFSSEYGSLKRVPEEISKCANLSQLYLGNNRLTGLPDSLGECRQLKLLAVQCNNISELPKGLAKIILRTMVVFKNPMQYYPRQLSYRENGFREGPIINNGPVPIYDGLPIIPNKTLPITPILKSSYIYSADLNMAFRGLSSKTKVSPSIEQKTLNAYARAFYEVIKECKDDRLTKSIFAHWSLEDPQFGEKVYEAFRWQNFGEEFNHFASSATVWLHTKYRQRAAQEIYNIAIRYNIPGTEDPEFGMKVLNMKMEMPERLVKSAMKTAARHFADEL